MRRRGFRRQAQDGDTGEVRGVITKRIAELEIESNEAPVFLARGLDDLIVASRGEILLVNRGDVVPCGYEEGLSAVPQVFVQLELQWASPRGTST